MRTTKTTKKGINNTEMWGTAHGSDGANREPPTADSHVSRILSRFTGDVLSSGLQLTHHVFCLGQKREVL